MKVNPYLLLLSFDFSNVAFVQKDVLLWPFEHTLGMFKTREYSETRISEDTKKKPCYSLF